jgi:hypothetical protein
MYSNIINATLIRWYLKNIGLHVKFKINCIIYNIIGNVNFLSFCSEANIIHTDILIKIYNIIQTILNIYPGGVKIDLFKVKYQLSILFIDKKLIINVNTIIIIKLYILL